MTLRILAFNAADTATASATTANSSYPASNLQTASRDEEFRTTSAAAAREIKLTWASNQTVNVVAVCRWNLSISASLIYGLFSDTAWTTGLENSGSVNPFDAADFGTLATFATDAHIRTLKNSVWYPASTHTTVKSLKIQIDDTGNPDGYIAATRIFVGAYLPFSRDAAYGLTLDWTEGTEQVRMDSGALRSVAVQPPYRRIRAQNRYVAAADRLLWSDAYRYDGLRRDLWVDIYPSDTTHLGVDHRGQFKFTSTAGISHDLPAHWSTSYTLEEA